MIWGSVEMMDLARLEMQERDPDVEPLNDSSNSIVLLAIELLLAGSELKCHSW